MRKTSAARLLLTLAVVAVAAACGEQATPTSPAVSFSRGKQQSSQSSHGHQLAQCVIPRDIRVSKRIGPSGGTLDLGYGNTVTFPKGALLTDTTITAFVPAGNVARVFFTPEGLVFPVQAIARLNVSACITPSSVLAVVYLQADTVTEVEPTVTSPDGKTVTATIPHFSSYAVAY